MRIFLQIAAICLFWLSTVTAVISGTLGITNLAGPVFRVEPWLVFASAFTSMMFCAAFYVLVDIADAVAPKVKPQLSQAEKKAA